MTCIEAAKLLRAGEALRHQGMDSAARKKFRQIVNSYAETDSAARAQELLDAPPAVVRRWTDSAGTHKVEAELLGVKDGMVTLRRLDGKELTLRLNKLSVTDQRFIRDHQVATPPAP